MPLFRCLLPILLFCLSANHALSQTGNKRTLDLSFVGDIMGHTGQIESAEVEKNEYYDYSPCFQYVKPYLSEADLAIGNLEVTLPGAPPYKGYPQFRSPDDLALALRDAGFDLLVTANNHSNDSYASGLTHTIDVLRQYSFFQTGTFKNQQERDIYYPLIVYKGDFKLAFLNYTYGTNGIPTKSPTVVNLIDEALIKSDIETARKFNPDAVIVLIHWGDEYQVQENDKQRRLGQKMFDWGADLIIGGHPHVVQPIKEVTLSRNGKTKKGLIAYSLGNFISGQTKARTDGGIILNLSLEKDLMSGETSLKSYDYIPVWRCIRQVDGKKQYVVLPIPDVENGRCRDLELSAAHKAGIDTYARHIRPHLEQSDCREKNLLTPAANYLKSTESTH